MRLEVIDFNNLNKIFEYKLTLEERTKLNEILLSNKFNNIEKRYILLIANFFKENTYIDEKLEINYLINFLDFILNEEIFNKLELFLVDLLYTICIKINKANYNVKINESKNETIIIKHNSVFKNETLEIDEIGRLKLKINTIINISNNIINLDNRLFYKLLNRILLSDVNANNYRMITELFNIDKLNNYTIKKEIILTYLLTNEINNINNKYIVLLTNDATLNTSDDKYKELVCYVFTLTEKEIDIYLSILSREELSLERKKILIDYLRIMLDKVDNIYSLDKVVKENLNVFNVVYLDYFKSLNDDEFKSHLDKITSSNKPMSYVKVLTDTNLDDEKKNYALNLINTSDIIRNDNNATDYMEYVALSAVSPLLKNLDINEYKKILFIVNKCCNNFNNLLDERYKDKTKLIDDRIILNDIAKGICIMLYKKELYINNIDRLYYTVNILLDIKHSYYNEVISFATNDNSLYYTDKEYKDILKLIERSYNGNRLYDYHMLSCSLYTDGDYIKRNKLVSSLDGRDGAKIIVDLFDNANIMFMEDKSILFEIAENKDKRSIINFIKELNRQGNYNGNVEFILNGVEESTSSVIIPSIKRIKKYKI